MALKNIGAYFTENQRFVDNTPNGSVTAEVTHQEICRLAMPTGRIIVCDPTGYMGDFTTDEVRQVALEKTISPGTYPVFIATAKMQFEGKKAEKDRPVIAAMLQVSDTPATSWIIAGLPGEKEKIAALKEGEFIGYGVDGGMSCFFDESFKLYIVEHGVKILDSIGEQINKTNTHATVVDSDSKTIIAVFTSGYGDGEYPVYLGLDNNGEVVAIVTDFDILFNAEPI